MRIPHARSVRIACVALLLGCGGGLEIRRDDGVDFGTLRTWSWLPNAARTIDAPPPYAIGLDRELAGSVEAMLLEQGFVRVDRDGDLRIGALLNVRREYENVVETGAVQQLSTYTSDGIYEIQRSTLRRQTFERVRLVVFAMNPLTGKPVWTGSHERRFEGEFARHLESVVGMLIAGFPTAGAASDRVRANELAATPAPTAPVATIDPDA
jgi:hypothetical protein